MNSDAGREPRSVKFHTACLVGGVVRYRFERVSARLSRRVNRMNRRDIVICLLFSAVLLGRVHAQQTGKVYYIATLLQSGSQAT
jgi:hypothetical protein